VALSGVEALALCARGDVDLVLLDVMMPGMDGPATLAALRALPGMENVPAVFMTAKVQPSELAQFKSLGAIDVIAKPFDPMALAARVRAIWNAQP
jgi:CheY-like chemotaxis protein